MKKKFFLQGGCQQICERLADRIGRERLTLNSPVDEIERKSDSSMTVRLQTGKEFTTKTIVLAIPVHRIPLLKFQPSLSSTRQHLYANMPAGNMIKFIATYETVSREVFNKFACFIMRKKSQLLNA